MYAKVSVKGDDETPLYNYLTKRPIPLLPAKLNGISRSFWWTATARVKRFEPDITPDSTEVTSAIEKALKQ